MPIDDPGDPRLDDFRDLTRADRRPDRPGGRGLVIAEGAVVVRRLLASPYPVRSLLGVQRRFDELAGDLAACTAPFYVTSAESMAEVVGFHLNRGVLAVADRARFPPAAELLTAARVVAVLEGVGDHENLGALFRNAAAPRRRRRPARRGLRGPAVPAQRPGVHGHGADGAVRRRRRGRSITLVNLLRSNGFRTAALSPAGEVTLADARLTAPVAVLLGAEGPGLSAAALAAADVRVRIPMSRGVDSLNVATAAAIAFAAVRR